MVELLCVAFSEDLLRDEVRLYRVSECPCITLMCKGSTCRLLKCSFKYAVSCRVSRCLWFFVNFYEPTMERERPFTVSGIAYVMSALYVAQEQARFVHDSRHRVSMYAIFFDRRSSSLLFVDSGLLSCAHTVFLCFKQRFSPA